MYKRTSVCDFNNQTHMNRLTFNELYFGHLRSKSHKYTGLLIIG